MDPFDWDAAKAGRNVAKHRVSFDEAASIFDDPLSRTRDDPEHSFPGDERLAMLGRSVNGRLLVVVHSYRGDTVRIISARQATARERRSYEEGE